MTDDRERLRKVAARAADFLHASVGGPDRSQIALADKIVASVASFLSCLVDDADLADTVRNFVRCVEHDVETRSPIEVEACAALLRALRLFEAHGASTTSGNVRRAFEGAKGLLPAGYLDVFKGR